MTETRMRGAGIWIDNGMVLLESLEGLDTWGIPGGRLEPGESVETCMLREYQEETGLQMHSDGLAAVHENFWEDGEVDVREYCFYFRVSHATHHAPAEVAGVETTVALEFRWFPLTDLSNLDIVPPLLPEIIAAVTDEGVHFFSTQSR